MNSALGFLQRRKTIDQVFVAGIISFALIRLHRSFGQYQGDERTYYDWAERVLDGNVPFVDWSPGMVALYSPFHLFSISNDWSLVTFKATLLVVAAVCIWVVIKRSTNRWLAYAGAFALVLNPMTTNGQSTQLAYAATAALLLVLVTGKNHGSKIVLTTVMIAAIIRPEFAVMAVLFIAAVFLLRSNRPHLSRSGSMIIILVGLSVFLFLLLGPKASNYPGGRMLQAFGQNHTRFHSAPGVVDPWNDWGVSVRYWFGNVASPWSAMRSNPSEYLAFATHNASGLARSVVRVARVGERTLLIYPTGLTAFALALLGLVHLLRTSRIRGSLDPGTIMLVALVLPVTGYIVIGHQQSVIDNLLVPMLTLASIAVHLLLSRFESYARLSHFE